MLILSNGLSEVVDEGFLKVANSLIKRIKAERNDVTVVSYERRSSMTDQYLELNKLLLNKKLLSLLRDYGDVVLYVPFPAKTFATALRIFMLSLFARVKPNVILVMKSRFCMAARILVKISGAQITVLSKDAERFYGEFMPKARVRYLRCGVDTARFNAVSSDRTRELKVKYGFDPDKPLILHVGHLKSGRNVGELLKIDKKYQVLLVTSTLTKNEQEYELRNSLLNASNVAIIDEYIPNIEEIYQMSDVYFFPTVAECNCIDVPLSCMEAASCNKPVITTHYGEMREFVGKSGFYHIDDLTESNINSLIALALETESDSRASVLEYDWDGAVKQLMQL